LKNLNNIITLLLLFVGLIVSSIGYTQSYQFSKYSIEEGLPQQYIYSLNQDDHGFIWVGTGDGISKFDGIEFQNYTTADGLAENFITCSAQRQKDIIWLGHNKGGISRIVDGNIMTIVSDSLVGSKISDIIIDQDNYVWATSQNGYIIRISPKLEVKKFDLFANEKNINCVAGKIEGSLLIGTDEGMYIWKLNNKFEPTTFTEIKALKLKSVQCIKKSNYLKNDFWIGTSESGLYQLRFTKGIEYKIRNSDDSFGIGNSSVKSINEDELKNLWVSTFSGLFKLVYDENEKGYQKSVAYNSTNGIGNFINTTMTDREGNVWIGMYGDGLAMLKDEIFVFYKHEDESEVPNDTRSFLFQDGVKWFGLSKGLLKIAPNKKEKWKYYNATNGFKNIAVTSIIARGDELYIATDGEGLFRFNTKTEKFNKEYLITSYLANNIHKLIGHINNLWIATEGGLIKKNIVTGETRVYNTLSGLKHNSIYDIEMLKNGSVVIGSHSNALTYIDKDGEVSHQMVLDADQLMDIVDIELDENNNVWIATLGSGVFKQEADSFIHISSKEGLKSDYCYSVISVQKKGVWVGHRGGLSRISKESFKVEVFDSKKGINDDFNKSATYTDEEGNIWFGTNKRTIKFNPKKFLKNSIPPLVSIKNIYISDEKTPTIKNIELAYSSYKLKIEFIGISFKQPEGIKYQYFLEGYDLNWSESTSDKSVSYPRINDGEYTFYVKACNNDGFCSEKTLGFNLEIASPFWKKWWFYIAVLIFVVFLVYLIILFREKKQKEIQKTLELELDKRTREVVKKSEELEEKNNNITDSINYALRIQKSILPSKRLMKELFPESFVFYQPRDIVSGDFYWYEQIGNKLIVACADCTGHGVPGAFMSMITSTLFKEIAHQHQITEPTQFLYKLDELLKNTLKKSDKATVHDGLDLSLCVFDLDTNHLSYSCASRPIIIYKEGVLERFKTSPFSIGGDDFIKKEFETTHIQLNKGDIVYLFTDGYPDQFGGEKGKKLYIKGFTSLLKKSIDLPMDQQYLILEEHLQKWKGNLMQVDDILVMGIKIS